MLQSRKYKFVHVLFFSLTNNSAMPMRFGAASPFVPCSVVWNTYRSCTGKEGAYANLHKANHGLGLANWSF